MGNRASRSDGIEVHPAVTDARGDDPSIHAALKDAPGARVRLTMLREGRLEEHEDGEALSALEAACRPDGARAGGATLWLDLAGADATLVQHVAGILGLHPLIAEDVIEGNQRSKLEVTDGIVHIVVFALEADDAAAPAGAGSIAASGEFRVETHEIDLVLGKQFLLSAHASDWDPRSIGHLKGGIEPIIKEGADHLVWAIVDGVVDGYFPFADRLEDLIDRLQDDVVDRPNRRTLERLFTLKRDLIAVRRAVSPVREILNQLTNRDLALIDNEEILYFRDVYDHVIRLADELDTDRELVAATVEIYLSTINNNLSVIMKRLTGVTVILAGVGAVAGIFGMSEAGLAFQGAEAGGFWMVTALVVAIAVVAAFVLRRIDWI
jgi:magnesium transporter